MEKNQSKRTFNTIHGKTKARLNKKEINHLTENVITNTTTTTKKFSIKKGIMSAFKSIFKWFRADDDDHKSKNPMRGIHGNKPIIKQTNKEAKKRSPEVRAKRNTARHSRKTNSSRGKRRGK